MKTVKIRLEPHYEYLAPKATVPVEVLNGLEHPPLAHQVETYKELKDNHVVFNSFPTGTGKTLAAYLHLIDCPNSDALVIAPTNALISQHAQDLRDFKKQSKIPHIIIEIDAEKLRLLKKARSIPRSQDAFYRVLNNPYAFATELGLKLEDKTKKQPLILVTNPDLFYYALYGLVNQLDRRNLSMEMFSRFGYIIIDEFHYYNAKQFSAFLFFISLSHSLGYFDKTARRVAILTATPNEQILEYFNRLADNDLKYTLVSPQNLKAVGQPIRTLGAMELQLVPYSSRNMLDFAGQVALLPISDWTKQGLTGAVISDRLVDISILSSLLKNKLDLEKITGAVSKSDRPQILKKSLLLATPTVDIGYNFKRIDKNRQNIDFLIFVAEYNDEFWQRLGRAARVLGKENKDFISKLVAFIPEPLEQDVQYYESLDNKKLSHRVLKESMACFLGSKPFNSSFIASKGLDATLSSMGVILQSITSDETIHLENALKLIQKVFAPGYKAKALRHIRAYNSTRYALETALGNNAPKDCLIEEYLQFYNDTTSPEKIEEIKNLLAKGHNIHFEAFIHAKRAIFQARAGFRGGSDGVEVEVYDPWHFLTNQSQETRYNLLHLLKYYELHLLEGSSQSKDSPLKVELSSLLQPDKRPNIGFYLESEYTKISFEEIYLRKFWAYKNLLISLQKNGAVRYIDPKLQNSLKERYIVMTILDKSDRRFINKLLDDFKTYPRELELGFADSERKTYLAIMGDMGEQILKRLELVKRWKHHVNDYVIV